MSNDSTTERSPFNRWWFIAGGFLVAIAVVLGLLLSGVIGAGNDGGGNNAGGNPGAPAASSSTDTGDESAAPAADTCSLEDGSQSIPTSGPKAQWKTNVYFQYPTSSEFGPTSNPKSSEWGCFAHSPTGALFAATNALNGLVGEDYKSFAEAAAVKNAGRDNWIADQANVPHNQTPGGVAQIAGFQFQSVQDDAAVVNIGVSQGELNGTFKVAVVWDDATNNWKVDIASSNLDVAEADISNYTTWGANNG